ncbi:MAG: hypothetical protein M3Y27_24925, partial [Acidobacteriota bacterium]|nr:hypothetical protein [Acidobacteriota bacterium]
NINGGIGRPAFWAWSKYNHADDPSPLFSSRRTEYVIVGYKELSERVRWAKLLKMAGYEPLQHFDGNLFWRTAILEPEAFDLYKHVTKVDRGAFTSILNMADPAAGKQLLSGFFEVEANAWRWTGPRFSVLLKFPQEIEQAGGELIVHLSIPVAQIQKLGAMTLSVDIDGDPLSPGTFSKAGEQTFRRVVQPNARYSGVLPVNFSFDKASPPSSQDERELGAIVTSISLQ